MAGQFDYPYQSSRITRYSLTKAAYNNIYIVANDAFFSSTTQNASISVNGIDSISSIGTATAQGTSSVNATAYPSGVTASSSNGIVSEIGAANISLNGIFANAQIGTAQASGSRILNGTATPYGQSTTSQIGTTSQTANGTCTSSSSSVSIVGNPPYIMGDGNIINDGILSNTIIGSTAEITNSSIVVLGNNIISQIGTTVELANGIIIANGVNVNSYIGNTELLSDALKIVEDIEAIASIGNALVVIDSFTDIDGIELISQIGSVEVNISVIAMPETIAKLSSTGVCDFMTSSNVFTIGNSVYTYISRPLIVSAYEHIIYDANQNITIPTDNINYIANNVINADNVKFNINVDDILITI